MQRLKTRAQFQAVMAGGIVARTPHFALHRAPLDTPEANASPAGPGTRKPQALFAVRGVWIGVVLPKRWARRAVTRNAIKRQTYSVARELEPHLATAAHVVRLRSSFDKAAFPSAVSDALKRVVRAELQQLLGATGRRAKP